MIDPSEAIRAEKQQTSVARKVFSVVPITEPWSWQQIMAELRRNQLNIEKIVVGGCLNALKQAGLVKEPSPGHFQRVQLREKISTQQTKESPMATEKPNPKPSDAIAGVAVALRKAADELDYLIIAMEEQTSSHNGELLKVRQLKAALAAIL